MKNDTASKLFHNVMNYTHYITLGFFALMYFIRGSGSFPIIHVFSTIFISISYVAYSLSNIFGIIVVVIMFIYGYTDKFDGTKNIIPNSENEFPLIKRWLIRMKNFAFTSFFILFSFDLGYKGLAYLCASYYIISMLVLILNPSVKAKSAMLLLSSDENKENNE